MSCSINKVKKFVLSCYELFFKKIKKNDTPY